MNTKCISALFFFFLFTAACPLMADVTITAEDAGAGVLRLNYEITGDSVVRGIALKLSDEAMESEAGPGDITLGTLPGDLVWAAIDYYFSNPDYLTTTLGGDETQLPGAASTAMADPDAAGALAAAASAYSVSLGVLDNSGAKGGLTGSGVLCTIQLTELVPSDGVACIDITEDTLRGGIVGDALGTVSIQAQQCMGPPQCYDRLTAAEQAEWDKYIAAGKTEAQMECWCWQYQCRADGDNTMYLPGVLNWVVYSVDLTMLVENWRLPYAAGNPCADFDHKVYLPGVLNWTVYSGDLEILVKSWRKNPAALDTVWGDGTPGSGNCPGYIAP